MKKTKTKKLADITKVVFDVCDVKASYQIAHFNCANAYCHFM